MSENKFENVSSVVDNYQQTDELFDEILNDYTCQQPGSATI